MIAVYSLSLFLIRVPRLNGWENFAVAAHKKTACAGGWSGNVLFSQGATPSVSSELEGLTSVFGMGTGVSLPLWSPPHLHVQAVQLIQYTLIATQARFGGDEGIRTPDLCRAKAALFQLSYIPSSHTTCRVGLPGLEPGTSVLSGLRSNHLS